MIPMLKNRLKTSNKNYRKMNILFLFLIISNIALFIGLGYYYSKIGIKINLKLIENVSTLFATLVTLGAITLRLPKLREHENIILTFGYFIMLCLISIMSAYFGDEVNIQSFFGTYLEMFKVLCVVLIFILLSLNLKSFKEVMHGNLTKKNLVICAIIFSAVGIFASVYHLDINGTPANVRCMIVMIGGLFGGPLVGIPAGIISAAYRFSLGGFTALPCAISTVLSGVIGSLIFIWNDRKFPRFTASLTLMFLFTGFEMLTTLALTPPDISFPYISNIYPFMLFASVSGMILFSIMVREERQKTNSFEEEGINELEEDYGEKINELEEDYNKKINALKDEIKALKKDNSDNNSQD